MIGTRAKKHQPCFTEDVSNSYLYLTFMNTNLKRICKKMNLNKLKYMALDTHIVVYFLKVALLFKKYKID